MKKSFVFLLAMLAIFLLVGSLIITNILQVEKFFNNEFDNNEIGPVAPGDIADENAYEDNEPTQEDIELSFEEQIWNDRIEAATLPSPCPDMPEQDFPESYYKGPLTDTHLHIPSIPDWPVEEEPDEETLTGRFGGPEAFLGWNVKMSDIACTIKLEGTHKNFAFFPVYDEEISQYQIEIWKKTMEQYPDEFTPFIMPSGNDDDPNGFPTVDAETLQEMLAVYPILFNGYGEIGLYERENGGSPALAPDSQRMKDIYHVVRAYDLAVYLHLGDGQKRAFEKALSENPDINFVWHGDQLSPDDVEDILSKHPNAYYGIDAFWGHDRDLFLLFVGGETKEDYVNELNARFNSVLNYAVSDWKSVIERHSDQIVWGIDRGDVAWNYDSEVGRLQVKLARAFIGKLKPEVQEKIAYKNAERLLT